jgi:hypothetical protein
LWPTQNQEQVLIALPLISTKLPKSLPGLWQDHLFDHQNILRVKRFHSQQLAGPIKQQTTTSPIKIDWSVVVKAIKKKELIIE